MGAFKRYLIESESDNTVAGMKAAISYVSNSTHIEELIDKTGAKNIEQLIQAVYPTVQQVYAQYRQALQKHESYSLQESWVGVILGEIGNLLWNVVSIAVRSITRTIGHLFGGLAGGKGSKVAFVADLVLTFALAQMVAGDPATAAMVWGASWIGLIWFGKNILEPALKALGEGAPEDGEIIS